MKKFEILLVLSGMLLMIYPLTSCSEKQNPRSGSAPVIFPFNVSIINNTSHTQYIYTAQESLQYTTNQTWKKVKISNNQIYILSPSADFVIYQLFSWPPYGDGILPNSNYVETNLTGDAGLGHLFYLSPLGDIIEPEEEDLYKRYHELVKGYKVGSAYRISNEIKSIILAGFDEEFVGDIGAKVYGIFYLTCTNDAWWHSVLFPNTPMPASESFRFHLILEINETNIIVKIEDWYSGYYDANGNYIITNTNSASTNIPF